MAANKFATKMQRNINKIIAILVYAVLEWTLISFLLLNSFFTYLIVKFASYFGLEPPCLWCSRVGHVFDPVTNPRSYRNLVCANHAREISNLGYCSVHGRLVEQQDMCEECLTSQPIGDNKVVEMSRRIAFFTWMRERRGDNVAKIFKCSCCNGSLTNRLGPPCSPFKPSWLDIDGNGKENLVGEGMDNVFSAEGEKNLNKTHFPPNDREIASEIDVSNTKISRDREEEADGHQISDVTNPVFQESTATDSSKMDLGCTKSVSQASEDSMIKCLAREDDSSQFIKLHYEDCRDFNFHRWITTELIDSLTKADQERCCLKELAVAMKDNQNGTIDSPIQPVKADEDDKFIDDQSESKIVISTNQSDFAVHYPPVQKSIPSISSPEENQSIIHDSVTEICEATMPFADPYKLETAGVQEDMALTSKKSENINEDVSKQFKANRADGEKITDTPTSVESMHYSQKKSSPLERKDLVMEEPLNGNASSEMESGDTLLTIEQMKEALKAERKAFQALYVELEAERSASTVAANQTMAMITRLQEEKAVMQMEALQYQRMMEEQSEYDQEALQLLNELMIKREKEKQELEKELELYRNKVTEYEEKEKIGTIGIHRNFGSGNSSASCSKSENNDQLYIDLYHEPKEDDDRCNEHGKKGSGDDSDAVLNLEEMALDCVKNMTALDESLADYEEERLSILDQLKALEDKLITMGADEGLFMNTMSTVSVSENCSNHNTNDQGITLDFSSEVENDLPNCLSKDLNGNHGHEGITMRSMAKSLLPLLDTTDNEVEAQSTADKCTTTEPLQFQNSPTSDFALSSKKLALEDVVDHVYEKLHALEADGEFLKNCMDSVKTEDKDASLFQEILQNLNDLRSVELRVRSTSDNQVE